MPRPGRAASTVEVHRVKSGHRRGPSPRSRCTRAGFSCPRCPPELTDRSAKGTHHAPGPAPTSRSRRRHDDRARRARRHRTQPRGPVRHGRTGRRPRRRDLAGRRVHRRRTARPLRRPGLGPDHRQSARPDRRRHGRADPPRGDRAGRGPRPVVQQLRRLGHRGLHRRRRDGETPLRRHRRRREPDRLRRLRPAHGDPGPGRRGGQRRPAGPHHQPHHRHQRPRRQQHLRPGVHRARTGPQR